MTEARGSKKTKQTKSRVIQNTLEYVVEYDRRPMNLQFLSGTKGKSCYVTEIVKKGQTPCGVIYAHSRLISINSVNVEKQLFDNIMVELQTAPLPLRLKLQSPPLPVAQKTDGGKRRKRRKHRGKMPTYGSAYLSEQNLRSITREPKHSQHRAERIVKQNPRESKDLRRITKKKMRRMSTGSSQILQNMGQSYDRASPLSVVVPQVRYRDQEMTPNEMKEELDYLRSALERIYSALIMRPSVNEEVGHEIQIPFNKKFLRYFQMFEVILNAARLKRVREQDDPSWKRAAPTPRKEDHDFTLQTSDLAGAINIDQWLGRIIIEVGVDHLNLESRAEECVKSLEAICQLKETNDMLGKQVRSLEDLLKFVNKRNEAAMEQVEGFKTKLIDVEQGVEKVVLKVSGLRDRVSSLAKCLTKVQQPRVNRLASELRLAPIQAIHAGARITDLNLINQLEPLTSLLDQMVNLVRKSEIVIRDGLLVKVQKSFHITRQNNKEQDVSISKPTAL